MAKIIFTKWFLFQFENCYWNCCLCLSNRHRQQVKLHLKSWQYPIKNYFAYFNCIYTVHMGKIWIRWFANKPLVSIFGLLIGEVLSFVACLTSSGRFSKRSKKDLFGLGLEAMPFKKSYCRPLNPNYLGLMIKWINNTIIVLVWSIILWQLSAYVLSWLEVQLDVAEFSKTFMTIGN